MVLVMIGALNVILLAMRQQDSVTQAVIDRTNSGLNQLNEKIQIKDVRVVAANNRLNLTVANNGGTVAELTAMYIVNETASPKQQYKYDLTNTVDGRSSVKGIGTTIPFTVKDLTNYSIRIVTKSGNTATMNIGSVATNTFQLVMFAIPPTLAPGGGNATIMMSITNNNTDTAFPKGIKAYLTYSGACTPTSLYPCTVTPQYTGFTGNNTIIPPGSSAMYKWVYNINSPDNTVYTFTGHIYQGVASNTATAAITLKLLDSNRASSSGTTDVLSLKFLSNVGLSLINPGPFGTESTARAGWGVVVSNPTGANFTVSRVTIAVTNPTGGSDKAIANTNCGLTQVEPTSGWTCPVDNVLQWSGSPITVAAYQSKAFIAAVPTGSTASGDIPAWLITANAYTSYGEYAKTGYSMNTLKNGGPMANVYFSKTSSSSSPLQTDIIGAKNSVPSNTVIRLNVSLTDFETGVTSKINNGAKIVINLPPQWSVVGNTVDTCPSFTCTVTPFSDSSVQITATRTADINGCISSCGASGARPSGTISFQARTPTVQNNWIYILSATSDGTITGSGGVTNNLAAISEFAVEVLKP